jgi:hypothetical protein
MLRGAIDIVIACCRDEADIIVPFIDFYLDQDFDYICLIDNGSSDDTVARIMTHQQASRIRLHQDPRPGYDMRLLEYLKLFEYLATGWIFFLDVDEFLPIPGGVKAFASQLSTDVTVLELSTAEMIPSLREATLLTTRREVSTREEIKVVWKTNVATKIYCGKHSIEGEPIVRRRDERLIIRHFHTRSETQFRRKLQNRLQTEAAIVAADGTVQALSAFSLEERTMWIEESRASLEADGWRRECERLARLQWTNDTSISDWYRKRYVKVAEALPEIS